MPYDLTWEDRGVVTRLRGVVTSDELIQIIRDQDSDPSFEGVEYILAVFSDSVVLEASSAAIRRAAEIDAGVSKRKPDVVVAIVASQTVIRGLSNLYRIQHEVMGGQWEMSIFETEEEARRWIAETLG